MTRFLLLTLLQLALTLAADSGLYIEKQTIETYSDSSNTFTYYVDGNVQAVQKSQYTVARTSVGSLYEDDFSDDTASCTTTACPDLRRIYTYLNMNGAAVAYTRILDASLKSSLGVNANPMGYVAPYPGYCSSDDSVPIIELYSSSANKYAYWSPLVGSMYANINTTTLDTTRYEPVRLVGYALQATPADLTLVNDAPDYVQSIGKSNYTHSYFPALELVEMKSGSSYIVASKPGQITNLMNARGYTFSRSLGVFLITPSATAAQLIPLDAVCGTRILLWGLTNAAKTTFRIFSSTNLGNAPTGYTANSVYGNSFQNNVAVCGGVAGLGQLTELVSNTNAEWFTYAADPAQIASLKTSGWTVTNNTGLGYVPIDQFGFLLINATFSS